MRSLLLRGGFGLALLAAAPLPAWAQMAEIKPVDEPRIVAHLVLDKPPRRRGRAFFVDPIAQRLVDGTWTPPQQDMEEPVGAEAPARWRAVSPNAEGWVQGRPLVGGYVNVVLDAPAAGTWTCVMQGHSWVWADGVRRTGDPYANGTVRLPVALRAGRNDLLFRTSRGRLRVRLERQRDAVRLGGHDTMLPTVERGAPIETEGAVVLVNGGDAALALGDYELRVAVGREPAITTPVPGVPARGVRKIPFRITAPAALAGRGSMPLRVVLTRRDDPAGSPPRDQLAKRLRVVGDDDVRRVTFRSAIDGSLQYYAVRRSTAAGRGQALFLSLHGAGVEAHGQAGAYGAKSWGHVVAATNRRPFGFDWEDWGRLDALEVLAHASARLRPDPRRIYLTGHSMGGHGTWQVGALCPDRFAAIGPSAGWIAFSTYGGGRGVERSPDPVVELLARASSPSHTLDYKRNYAPMGVYVLHGEADDNVPADQARRMLKELEPFHRDVRSHFEPKVKHWWDRNKREPGADCVDWQPMFEFFARRARPTAAEVHHVAFRTPSPGISDRCHWVRIVQQERQWLASGVDLRCDVGGARIHGTTENVRRLELDIGHLRASRAVSVELDGQTLEEWSADAAPRRLAFQRDGNDWRAVAEAEVSGEKGPRRYGPFKAAFTNRFCLVYGTGGTDAEQAWARGRARHDAEVWWYRANGSVDVYADTAFDPSAHPERSVICYGNAETNRVWAALTAGSPIGVTAGLVRVGARELVGADLAILACVPRAGTAEGLVGLVGGTGIRAMRATDGCPIFVSGVAYPDVTVFTSDLRTRGLAAVRGTGYFGNDWSVERGEFAWRE